MRLIEIMLIVAVANVTSAGPSGAETPALSVPVNCLQLDQQLEARGGLGLFLKHAVDETRNDSSRLDRIAACKKIEKTADFVGALLGIASYCDVQDMLHKGSAGSPIYKRLAAFLRLMSNDLHELASKRSCGQGG